METQRRELAARLESLLADFRFKPGHPARRSDGVVNVWILCDRSEDGRQHLLATVYGGSPGPALVRGLWWTIRRVSDSQIARVGVTNGRGQLHVRDLEAGDYMLGIDIVETITWPDRLHRWRSREARQTSDTARRTLDVLTARRAGCVELPHGPTGVRAAAVQRRDLFLRERGNDRPAPPHGCRPPNRRSGVARRLGHRPRRAGQGLGRGEPPAGRGIPGTVPDRERPSSSRRVPPRYIGPQPTRHDLPRLPVFLRSRFAVAQEIKYVGPTSAGEILVGSCSPCQPENPRRIAVCLRRAEAGTLDIDWGAIGNHGLLGGDARNGIRK